MKDRMRKKLAVKQGPKKICLTMIVKNESKNVDRLLDSFIDKEDNKCLMDMISVVDTGSTDNTKELFLQWGEKHNVPTTVHEEPFKNFSHNRTHSIRAAKQAYPEADYFLLSDADFVWEINKGNKFDKSLLIDHKYLVEQYNKSLSYWNIRMLSARVEWECIGVTHEYWAESKSQGEYCGEVRTAKIKTIAIDDREDGGCKTDKFERDERLLREGLEDKTTPEHLRTRYKFYLGQTLKDMGRHVESIEWYGKRVLDQGWAEEVYFAKYQIGYNHEQLGWKKKHAVSIMGKLDKTIDEVNHLKKWNQNNLGPAELMAESTKHFTDAGVSYLAAYNYRKTRAESLYYLTRMYRLLGMNDMAYNLATIGAKIKYPEEDSLFIERNCYDYMFDYELSIVAFYLPDKRDIGRQAVARLMARKDLPSWIVDTVEKNSRHYI
jgi:glycosyltransferase involved in cell wall biosynthesis